MSICRPRACARRGCHEEARLSLAERMPMAILSFWWSLWRAPAMSFNASQWDNGVWIGAGPSPDPYGPDGPFGVNGPYITADPLHPGYAYRDDPTVPGGVQRLDAQGHVVGTASLGAPTAGGQGFDLTHLDPQTGMPQVQTYPQQAGGLFGLGDVWGTLLGSALVLGAGFGLGAAAPTRSR